MASELFVLIDNLFSIQKDLLLFTVHFFFVQNVFTYMYAIQCLDGKVSPKKFTEKAYPLSQDTFFSVKFFSNKFLHLNKVKIFGAKEDE